MDLKKTFPVWRPYDHNLRAIAAILAEAGRLPPRVILKNMGKTFAPEGSVPELDRSFGLDAAAVAEAVRKAVDHGA